LGELRNTMFFWLLCLEIERVFSQVSFCSINSSVNRQVLNMHILETNSCEIATHRG
jgi:hypothetical protein